MPYDLGHYINNVLESEVKIIDTFDGMKEWEELVMGMVQYLCRRQRSMETAARTDDRVSSLVEQAEAPRASVIGLTEPYGVGRYWSLCCLQECE